MDKEWIAKIIKNKIPFKKIDSNSKNSLNRSLQKPLSRQQIFVQTLFLTPLCEIIAKTIHAAKLLAFSPHFLFRPDQNHHFNST